MIAFPIQSLMDEQACYDYLLSVLYPQGLHCPQGHPLPADQGAHLARELGLDRARLLEHRHEMQKLIEQHFPSLLKGMTTEADEMYQNAGEKGVNHEDPDDPPRRRANKVKGHGTWGNDRLPVAGVVGRESGEIRLAVCQHSDRETLQPFVEQRTPDTMSQNFKLLAIVLSVVGALIMAAAPLSAPGAASAQQTPGQIRTNAAATLTAFAGTRNAARQTATTFRGTVTAFRGTVTAFRGAATAFRATATTFRLTQTSFVATRQSAVSTVNAAKTQAAALRQTATTIKATAPIRGTATAFAATADSFKGTATAFAATANAILSTPAP